MNMSTDKRSILLLLSGGYDSLALGGYLRLTEPDSPIAAALFFDYGQAASEEERAAAASWCERNSIPFLSHEIDIDGVDQSMNIGEGAPGPRVVPGRNLIFVALAVAAAVNLGAQRILIGATGEDIDYPDCRPSFYSHLSLTIQTAYGVSVEAPFGRYPRSKIAEVVNAYGIDVRGAFSCYQPRADGSPCEICNSCKQER